MGLGNEIFPVVLEMKMVTCIGSEEWGGGRGENELFPIPIASPFLMHAPTYSKYYHLKFYLDQFLSYHQMKKHD